MRASLWIFVQNHYVEVSGNVVEYYLQTYGYKIQVNGVSDKKIIFNSSEII